MGHPRALTLTVAGTAWVVACLAVPPLLVNWIVPLAPVPTGAASAPALTAVPPVRPVHPPSTSRPAADSDRPRRLDLYGNEIARPVARYRVDPRGTLYEVHSPDTEVPRLPPPRL